MAELRIWMNDAEVASWQASAGTSQLRYLDSWAASRLARPLSLSLPILPDGEAHRGGVVENFFDNLLPDSLIIRRRLRDRFATDGTGSFDGNPPTG